MKQLRNLAVFGLEVNGSLQNTNHNWATLLGTVRGHVLNAVWVPLVPALAITLMVITFNLLGEGLRQFFNKLKCEIFLSHPKKVPRQT
jgi:ABC-type dipeptide/oligopeptide/nickel transport system permease subunit